jgi:hypothetical protein
MRPPLLITLVPQWVTTGVFLNAKEPKNGEIRLENAHEIGA